MLERFKHPRLSFYAVESIRETTSKSNRYRIISAQLFTCLQIELSLEIQPMTRKIRSKLLSDININCALSEGRNTTDSCVLRCFWEQSRKGKNPWNISVSYFIHVILIALSLQPFRSTLEILIKAKFLSYAFLHIPFFFFSSAILRHNSRLLHGVCLKVRALARARLLRTYERNNQLCEIWLESFCLSFDNRMINY